MVVHHFLFDPNQTDNLALKEAIQSRSQPILDEMLSRGSRCLRAGRVIGNIDIKVDIGMIMRSLSQNNWIRVADFTGLCLASVDDDPNDGVRASTKVRQLAKALRSNELISEIRLVGADLSEADVRELEAALKANKAVKTFSVERTQKEVPPAPATAPITQLANVLRTNASITELRLDGSDLCPSEIEELVAALKCNAFIKTLHLFDFDFTGSAGEALVDLVHQLDVDSGSRRHASAIEALAVTVSDDCDMEDFPSAALFAALKCNSTLTSIGLDNFCDSGASAVLIDALEHNPRILSVNIDGDDYEDSDEIAASIDRILRARFLASRSSADDSNSR